MHSRTPASFVCDFHAVCSYKFKSIFSVKRKQKAHASHSRKPRGRSIFTFCLPFAAKTLSTTVHSKIHSFVQVHTQQQQQVYFSRRERAKTHKSLSVISRARREKKLFSRRAASVCQGERSSAQR